MPIDEVNIIYTGDCLERLKLLPDNSIDSIVTDPPYGISFMGKKWDYNIPTIEIWKECLRVLKPGGHLLSFGGTRTFHRICCSIEDAGFEIRDTIMWVYGSGFPKSHNVALAVDKLNGYPDRGRAIPAASTHFPSGRYAEGEEKLTSNPVEEYEAKSEASIPWEGWGTQLKPAYEPIIVARKPLEGTVAQNVLKYGTGGINIDSCRVTGEEVRTHSKSSEAAKGKGIYGGYKGVDTHQTDGQKLGRFPANIIHDGSPEVLEHFPGNAGGGHWAKTKVSGYGKFGGGKSTYNGPGEKDGFGSAARFFYCAKASRNERDFGLEGKKNSIRGRDAGQDRLDVPHKTRTTPIGNPHPTVKPLELICYLARLVTPPNGIVLDPFVGSGTTAIAALLEGFRYIGIEREREYAAIARKRIRAWKGGTPSSRRSQKGSSERSRQSMKWPSQKTR
jgi:site-specific DNA-methyltransferase (adenine-specific)